ncbi:hypothetical protein ACIBRY_29185 [Streptomyces anulatus]
MSELPMPERRFDLALVVQLLNYAQDVAAVERMCRNAHPSLAPGVRLKVSETGLRAFGAELREDFLANLPAGDVTLPCLRRTPDRPRTSGRGGRGRSVSAEDRRSAARPGA